MTVCAKITVKEPPRPKQLPTTGIERNARSNHVVVLDEKAPKFHIFESLVSSRLVKMFGKNEDVYLVEEMSHLEQALRFPKPT